MLQQFYPQPKPHDYMYELNKDFQFAAAHFIPDKHAGSCAKVHGHTYFVNITVAGDQLDDTGFLVNFKELKDLVHKRYDHTLLNESDDYTKLNGQPYLYPTTEIVAETIWTLVQNKLNTKVNKPKCLQVLVRETPTSYVVYRPKGV